MDLFRQLTGSTMEDVSGSRVLFLIPSQQRQMVRAELLGSHSHRSLTGSAVHVWTRAGRYLARGRHQGLAFGKSLSDEVQTASALLRQLLTELDTGAFERPSEARHRPLKNGAAPRLDCRQLVSRYVAAIRKSRGKRTACNYLSRLIPAIEFTEVAINRRRWPLVLYLDGSWEFAIEFKAFLYQRMVTRNGNPVANPKRMSARQVRNVLSTISAMLNQAKHPAVNLLPATFANPFTREVIGPQIHRDPLEQPKLPVDVRVDLVGHMDKWQLATLAFSLVLPGRPDEFTGLLISAVDRNKRELIFSNQWGGDDYNKARQAFRVPYPIEFDPIINWLVGGRTAGPLLRRRKIREAHRELSLQVQSNNDISKEFDKVIAGAATGEVQNDQDRKRLFRRLLRNLGGVDGNDLAKEFKALLAAARPNLQARFYDLRSAVITGLREAGVSEILRQYICGRSLGRNSAIHYESQDLHGDMARYFQHVRPLLDTIAARTVEVGMTCDGTHRCCAEQVA